MRILLCVIPLFLLMISCGGNQRKIIQMQAKIDSLQSTCAKNDEVNSYISEMDIIYNKLEVIKINQALIDNNYTPKEEELTGDKRKLIQENINTIQQLMYENYLKMDSLKNKIKNSPLQNPQLESMLNQLNQDLFAKGSEINNLTKKLEKINIFSNRLYEVTDSLTDINKGLTNTNYKQELELNTIYFCKGTFKELTTNKVLD